MSGRPFDELLAARILNAPKIRSLLTNWKEGRVECGIEGRAMFEHTEDDAD